ncbi:MAG: hypothetical protein QOK49_4385 [Baekduia sp.]|nr:hypothetical protein [Baekduia sp.]
MSEFLAIDGLQCRRAALTRWVVTGLTAALLLIVAPAAGAATVDTWPDFTGRQVVSGQTLDGTSTASGTPAAVISYEWQQCDPIAVCSPIPGEVGPTYAVRTADVGFQIQLVVTATDLGSPDTKSSGRTAPVMAPAQLTGPPTISGTAATGQTLTASASATGTPTPTITFQWQRCDSAGAACADIAGENTSQHVLGSADAAKTLRVVATATNAAATDTQTSAATAPVTDAAKLTGPPTIAGTATTGQTLTATATATGEPTPSVAYQWQRCDSTGAACADIAGENTNQHVLTSADAAKTLRVVATATNTAGTDTQTSAATAPVTDAAKLTGPPTISGAAATGQTLTASASATGTPTPTSTFQWQRCDSTGAGCADIAGENTNQHVLGSGDAGKTLRVVATATNTTGTDTQTSAATAVIPSPADDGTGGTTTTPADTSGATIVSSAPTPAPVPDGPTPTPGPTAGPTPAPARLQPFPVVRIRGQLVRGGARVSVFSVTAPKGARIEIGCSGRGCPRKSLALTARKSGLVRLRAYERYLPAGVRITVRVSQPKTIGKYASFVIRADGGPRRQDMCLPPGKRVPVRCSA